MLRAISDCLSDESSSSGDYTTTKEINFVFPENRSRWETDTKCSVCRINFNIPGVAHTEKGKCFFCYRGVCRRCLSSSKTHPESKSKEKICKVCIVEFKQIRFYSNKIEESKLEVSQLKLEVELASKENCEATFERKLVQKSVERFKAVQNSTVAEKEVTIDELKDNLSKLTIRHEISENKNIELGQQIKRLKLELEEGKKRTEKWKDKNLKNDEEDEKAKRNIERVKKETLDLVNSVQKKSTAIGEVVESMQELKRSVEEYQIKLEAQEKCIEDMKEKLLFAQMRSKEFEEEIQKLNEKILNVNERDEENSEITQEEEEKLKDTELDLNKQDEIIEKLNARLELLKRSMKRSNIFTSEKFEKSYRQCEILANISHVKKTGMHKKDPSGSSACQKCVVC